MPKKIAGNYTLCAIEDGSDAEPRPASVVYPFTLSPWHLTVSSPLTVSPFSLSQSHLFGRLSVNRVMSAYSVIFFTGLMVSNDQS
jgi:hypothetical protein